MDRSVSCWHTSWYGWNFEASHNDLTLFDLDWFHLLRRNGRLFDSTLYIPDERIHRKRLLLEKWSHTFPSPVVISHWQSVSWIRLSRLHLAGIIVSIYVPIRGWTSFRIEFDSQGYNWTVILPAELSAAAVLVNYWYVLTLAAAT